MVPHIQKSVPFWIMPTTQMKAYLAGASSMYLMIVFKALSGKTKIDMLKLLMMGEYHVSVLKRLVQVLEKRVKVKETDNVEKPKY